MSKAITTSIPCLAKSLRYATERPYATDFLVDHIDGAQATNHRTTTYETVVRPVSPTMWRISSLDQRGFCFIRAPTSITSRNSDDTTFVTNDYFAEIEKVIRANFPDCTRLECIDYQVRDTTSCL